MKNPYKIAQVLTEWKFNKNKLLLIILLFALL